MSHASERQTALVTGGMGFIGRALARQLHAAGQRVVVLDNLSMNGADLPAGADLVQGDVRDGGLVQSVLQRERPGTLYHLAAIHYIPACEADPANCVSVNTAGAASVLEACSKVDAPPACVLASTAAVYAPSSVAHVETDALAPVDIYGLSKLWLEQIAALYATRNGLRVSIARLFNVYGPGETNPHLIPSLIAQAVAGGVIQAGDLSTRRDYVHVEDVAHALVLMGGLQHDGLVCINVGTGRAVSGREVVETIAHCLARSLETATDLSRLRRVDRPLLLSDPRLAESLLGWRAEVSFEQGICELLTESSAAQKV
jgi:UDP-glucose 4-epimerase